VRPVIAIGAGLVRGRRRDLGIMPPGGRLTQSGSRAPNLEIQCHLELSRWVQTWRQWPLERPWMMLSSSSTAKSWEIMLSGIFLGYDGVSNEGASKILYEIKDLSRLQIRPMAGRRFGRGLSR